jgi:hypothetical protein
VSFVVEDNYGRSLCSLVNLADNNLETNWSDSIMRRNTKNLVDFFFADQESVRSEVKYLVDESQLNQSSFDKLTDCLEFPSSHFSTEEIVINDVSMLSSIIR